MAKVNFSWDAFYKEMEDKINYIVINSAYDMQADIRRNMERTLINYDRRYKRPWGIHHPSADKQFPAIDLGRLYDSITVNWAGSGMARATIEKGDFSKYDKIHNEDGVDEPKVGARVGTNCYYWFYLEEGWQPRGGGRRIPGRWFMKKSKIKWEQIIKKRIDEVKGGFTTAAEAFYKKHK